MEDFKDDQSNKINPYNFFLVELGIFSLRDNTLQTSEGIAKTTILFFIVQSI